MLALLYPIFNTALYLLCFSDFFTAFCSSLQITGNPLISIIIRRRETESVQLHADNASVFRKISFIQNMYLAATPFIVSFAVMTAVPAPLAVTFPFWSTVATLVSLELTPNSSFCCLPALLPDALLFLL